MGKNVIQQFAETAAADLIADAKRAQNWIASQGGAQGLSAEGKALLNQLQASTAAVEKNLPAVLEAAGKDASAIAVLGAAFAAGNPAGILAAVVSFLAAVGASETVIKEVVADYEVDLEK